jgi:DNA-binding protein Fis
MFRVLLVTRNRALALHCRKNLPEGYRLRSVSKLNLRSESLAGSIVIFDSNYLTESTDAIVAALAELYAAERGGVSLGLLMHEDDRAKAFSLFPQNLNHIDSMGHYRLQAGRVQGLGRSEWFWLLDSQRKKLQQLGERILVNDENEMLTRRLARLEPESHTLKKFPAFMQGRSNAILKFREQVIEIAAAHSYLTLSCTDAIPSDEFVEYYAALISPLKPLRYQIIDLAKIPAGLHAAAIWPQRKKPKKNGGSAQIPIVCVKNAQLLNWQNQGQLLQHIKSLRDADASDAQNRQRYVLEITQDIGQLVRRGSFRQELLSVLRKAATVLPALHERAHDISQIAAEYIARRKFAALAEGQAELASKILERFDFSSGYAGLYLTLDLLHDLAKSKGIPVFELFRAGDDDEAFRAAKSFLREQVEPEPTTLFQGLAGSEKEPLSLDAVERSYIAAVCERYGWQVTEAARHLAISRKTLYDKMKRYKLTRPENSGRRNGRRAS